MLKKIQIRITSPVASLRRARRPLFLLLLVTLVAGTARMQGPVVAPPQVEGGIISGVAQDDRSAPLADVKVSISSKDFSASVRTQADGKFEFRNLKPDTYRITAEAVGFRKERTTVNITRPDEALNPVIKLSPSSLHVTVFDVNNQPLDGVTVALYTQERGAPPSVASRTTTDESGDAYFGRLSPDSYQLTAALRGYEEYRNEVFISSGITTELPLQLLVAPVIPINEKLTERFSVPNLPSKNVRSIFQDSEGWVWFGTDRGIARFNGADFKSSAMAASPYEQLIGEDVQSIAEDQQGTVWLGTPRGVRRISKAGAEVGEALSGRDVQDIKVDSRGNVWLATASGVFMFDGKDFVAFGQSEGLPSNDVRAIAEDKNGKIWIATANGAATIDEGKVEVFKQGDDLRGIFVDRAGTIWFATARGVQFYDGKRVNNLDIAAFKTARTSEDAESGARAISQDKLGRMWFALLRGGALIYDPARQESQQMSLLDRDHVAVIFTGREGNVWFGTEDGAVRADLYSFVNFTTSRGLPDNDVRAVVEMPPSGSSDIEGRLWFATAGGVSRMEGGRFVPVEGFRPNVEVRAIVFDRAGEAWFATGQGVFRSSGQTRTQINEGNGLASNNVHYLTPVTGGSAMMFATAKGVSVFKNGEIHSLEGLAGYDVRHIFEDADGRLWFATARGIVNFNPATEDAKLIDTSRGLADNDARWITRFNNQLLVATRAGVQVYNDQDTNRPSFTTLDGEPANTLFVDRDNFLWIGTDDGKVEKFAAIGGYMIPQVYSGENYALTGSRINSIYEDSEGEIWISTDKGAVRHLPIRVAPLARVSLEVDGHPDTPSESGTYSLSYGRQRLTFHFTAVSMSGVSMNGQVRYLYRVKSDQGERWSLLPVQPGVEREVNIFSLDAGTHTFELMALNRDLYGKDAPAAALSIRVGQPFWKRWWFYALALALIGITVAFVITARRAREREYVLPKELRSYVAIEPNPYIVGNPIRSENMFYGREDDFRYVRTKLESVNQGVIIVFCGERRVGKSSILYQVLNGRLGPRFIPVFVDMQEMVIANDAEFFARTSRLIAEAVARSDEMLEAEKSQSERLETERLETERLESAALTGAPRAGATAQAGSQRVAAGRDIRPIVRAPAFDQGNPYPVFIDFLDDVLRDIGDRALLILIDEYELMEAKVDEGKLSPELFTFLAGLMDNKERLAFIFTGSRRLEERDKKYWRELLRRSLFRKVGFLSKKDAIRLITEPVEGRVVYGRGVIEELHRLTAGQPFYAQVLCQNTVDYLNEHEQNWVTLSDLNHVVSDIVDNPLPQMIYMWDGLSDDEKLALSLMAEMLPDGRTFATAQELRSSVKSNEYPVNLSENTIRVTLEELFRREMVEKDSADGFRFKIDLFRLWIRRSHSIWQVVKEVRTL